MGASKNTLMDPNINANDTARVSLPLSFTLCCGIKKSNKLTARGNNIISTNAGIDNW